jgi:peptidyl-prolyl cis-trans isomerase C
MFNFDRTLIKVCSIVQEIKFLGPFIVGLSLTVLHDTRATELKSDPVVALVNNFKFYKSDIERARKQLLPEAQEYSKAAVYQYLLKNLIDTHLVVAAARKEGLERRSKIIKQVRRNEDRILHQAYLDERIAGILSDKQLKERYQTYLKSSLATEEIRASHILVQTREQAIEVIRQLNKGADFANLAKNISTGPSRKQGGDMGYFTRERMVPSFSKAAFATSLGEFTPEPIKTQFGWHIIKVEDKRILKPKSFDQVKMQLRKKMIKDLVDSIASELRKSAKVETFGPDGK